MSEPLSRVLVVKIVLTIVLWSMPLLFTPDSLLQQIGFPPVTPSGFLKLLGMAYSALAVGYIFGLRDLRSGIYPEGVIWVGIVSNGGACLILLIGAALDVWDEWSGLASLYMWASLICTGGITAGLIAFGPCRRRN